MTHTLRFHCGFEAKSVALWSGGTALGATLAVEESITSLSRVALRFLPGTGGTPALTFLGEGFNAGGGWVDNVQNWHGTASWHMYIVSLPTAGNYFYYWRQSDATITRAVARIRSDGKVELLDEGGGVGATSTQALAVGHWYVCTQWCTGTYFRFVARDRDTGVTVLDVTRPGGSNATRFVTFGCWTTSYGDVIVDNFVWESDATEANVDDPVTQLTTKYAVNRQLPIGVGFYDQGTNDWSYLDEIPTDGDTTTRVIDGQKFTCVVQPTSTFPAAVGTVFAVLGLIYSRNGACTGSSNVQVSFRSGGTDLDSGVGWCSVTYVNPKLFRTTDPATGAAWTLSAVDSLQVGAVEAGTGAAGIISTVLTEVLYSTTSIERRRRIDYYRRPDDPMQRFMDYKGRIVPYNELRPNRWLRRMTGPPRADSPASFWQWRDLTLIEGLVWTQDESGMSVEIRGSKDDFVDSLIRRISDSSGGL